MTSYVFDWVDAFTDQAFGGNGCAVVHDAGTLTGETCQAFVRETSLVECTFLEPSEVADIKVRYFLASREIPFAGHPTIATVASLVARGLTRGRELMLETGAGLVPITIDAREDVPRITMTQVAPVFGPDLPRDLVAAVGGIAADDIIATPQVVSTGLPFCITVLRDHDVLRRLVLDQGALARLATHLGHGDSDMMEPFWVTLEGATAAGDTFSRLLIAPPSPPEDAFTGSASGAMAAYLWRHGLIESPRFVAEQGHWMGRPGRAEIEVLGPPDAITGVRVSGQGRVLMSGQLHL
ncbi:phenazine biosynthesis protein PhzF family [Roseovarius lutimaris]|uniref:Phenazine biosynthesis protein PhzF family n=1 Tax=Roseovarius lutimaris TaxID=1005928 RepID=A0A1I5EBJ7_9RHOB|nr:PhzF family phenazine biosynthesis protein [Roseovarius lutimaris]SFO08441.1 phenazine biosynthesis protein PhzF family [Roseovarius lutimaris]